MFKRTAEEDAESPRPENAEVLDSEDSLPPAPGSTTPASTPTDPHEGAAPPAPEPSSTDEVDIHSLLRRLDDVARAAGGSSGPAVRSLAAEVEEHAESLSASVTARQEAQRLLALATEERNRASADGSAIVQEARQIAARLTNEAQSQAAEAMAEIQRWATGQRDSIAEVVAELTRTAHRDAESIRADAQESALDEARRTAEVYVARAAALATRDAGRHRAEAVEVLDRSAQTVAAAHTTMQEFTESLSGFVTTMSGHLETLQEVMTQAEAGRAATALVAPIAVDAASWAEAGGVELEDDLVLLPLDPFTPPVGNVDETVAAGETGPESLDDAAPEDETAPEPAVEPEEDETHEAESVDADPEDDAPTPTRSGPDAGAGFPEDGEGAPADRSVQLPPPPVGRPLGSLFRDVERD